MKKILFLGLIFVWSCALAYSQQALMYQAVLRSDAGEVLENQDVQIKVSIKDVNNVVYVETISTKTNSNGLATFLLGIDGTPTQIRNDFKAIDWKDGKFFIQLEKVEGDVNFKTHAYHPIGSVPWTFAAFDAAGDLDDRLARIEAYLRLKGLIP